LFILVLRVWLVSPSLPDWPELAELRTVQAAPKHRPEGERRTHIDSLRSGFGTGSVTYPRGRDQKSPRTEPAYNVASVAQK
jgi:hypothetical protein